jgi:hypothetical protein
MHGRPPIAREDANAPELDAALLVAASLEMKICQRESFSSQQPSRRRNLR